MMASWWLHDGFRMICFLVCWKFGSCFIYFHSSFSLYFGKRGCLHNPESADYGCRRLRGAQHWPKWAIMRDHEEEGRIEPGPGRWSQFLAAHTSHELLSHLHLFCFSKYFQLLQASHTKIFLSQGLCHKVSTLVLSSTQSREVSLYNLFCSWMKSLFWSYPLPRTECRHSLKYFSHNVSALVLSST